MGLILILLVTVELVHCSPTFLSAGIPTKVPRGELREEQNLIF